MSIKNEAWDYAAVHSSPRYDEIVAHAGKKYATEAERKAFVDAVLDANIVISNKHSRQAESDRSQIAPK